MTGIVSSRTDSWTQKKGFFRDQRLTALGIAHGVTTRPLGNMKDVTARAAALIEAGLSGKPALLLKQVHGVEIRTAVPGSDSGEAPTGDGWVTDAPGLTLCVFVADCIPLFLFDSAGRAGGLFHVGWRGAQAGMPGAAVRALKDRFGVAPRDIRASIGPHIGACCLKVGPEFAGKFAPSSLRSDGGGLFLDLGAETRRQLAVAGLSHGDIADSPACTSCQTGLFYSYRREKQDVRMMAFLSLTP